MEKDYCVIVGEVIHSMGEGSNRLLKVEKQSGK